MSKKLSYEQFKALITEFDMWDLDVYNAILPYLADEQPTEQPQVTNGYQKLFDYMQDEHGVTLLVTDMDEIIRIVHGMQPTKPEPSRLEVAMNLLAAHISKPNAAYAEDLVSNMFKAADELIKKSKQTP